jgi:PAS domain S-box-containing protein
MPESIWPQTSQSDDSVDWPARIAELEARLAQQTEELEIWRTQHQRLIKIVEEADAMVFALDSALHISYINPHTALAFGRPPEQIIGLTLWEIQPKLQETHWGAACRQAISEQTTVRFEAPGIRADSWYKVVLYPVPHGLYVYAQEITDHIQQAAQLELQAHMLQDIHEAVIAVDMDQRIVYLNAAAATQYDIAAEAALGQKLTDIYTYTWLDPTAEAQAAAALAADGWWQGENLHHKQNGDTLHVDSTVSLWSNAQGQVQGMVAVIRDISTQKSNEQALARERELQQKLFERLPVLLTLFDPETNLLYFNRAFEQTFGWTTAEAAQLDMMEKFYPDPAYRAVVQQYMQSGQEEWREFEVMTKSGEVVPSSWSNIYLTDTTLVGVGIDLRERRRQEAALQNAHQQLDKILTRISDIFLSTDTTWQITYLNDQAQTLCAPLPTAQTGQALIGKPLWEILPAWQDSDFEAHCRQALAQRHSISFETQDPQQANWYQVNLYADEAGLSIFMRDVTQQRSAELAFHNSEERFRIALANSSIMVYTTDRKLRYTWIYNPQAGFQPQQVLGKRDDEIVPPADAAQLLALKQQVLDSGIGRRSELSMQGKDYDLTVEPLHNAAGEVVGLTIAAVDVTEQVRLRREREEAFAQLDALFASSPIGLSLSDSDLRFVRVNQALADINGLSQAEHIGKRLGELRFDSTRAEYSDPSRAHYIEAIWQQMLQDGTPRIGIEIAEGPDSIRQRHWSVTWYPIWLRGNIIGIGTLVEDYTERKHAEMALRESEQRYRTLAANFPNGAAFVLNRDLRYTLAEGQALATAGLTTTDLEGKTIWEALDPQLVELYEPYFHQALAGRPFRVEHAAHGRYFVSHGTPLYNAQGQVNELLAVSYDITDRKEVEDALRASEQRYRDLLASIDEGFALCEIIVDANGQPVDYRFLEINPAFTKLTGITLEQAATQTIRERLPRVESMWIETYGRVALEGTATRFESYVAALDRWYSTYAVARGEGKFAVLFTDVTQRRQAEEELRTLANTLESRVQMRTQEVRDLAARLSIAEQQERKRIGRILHDHVQQILYGIQMRTSLLALDISAGSAESLREHVQEMDHLIKEAIQAARDMAVELAPPILDEQIRHVVRWLAEYMRGLYQLTVAVEFVNDCEVDDKSVRILLFQLLRELLFNIVKHAEVNQASITLWRDTQQLTVVVADEGKGFAQTSPMQNVRVATGYGLAGLQERLQLFGGTMQIDSAPGKGTQVTLTLPLEAQVQRYQ